MSSGLSPINLVIIIPVYNGRDSILRLIKQIKSIVDYPIIVIDDGSTDGIQASDFQGISYLKHSLNRGKGSALKTGLNHARNADYDYAITLDADGQHDPKEIPNILNQVQDNPEALVVGMRNLVTEAMPFHRKLSNNITSSILSLRTSLRIRDSQVGYRCYPLKDRRLWDSIEDGFQLESAVFFNAAKLKIPLVWQPIEVIYGAEQSHMHLLKDTLKFIRTFFRSFKC